MSERHNTDLGKRLATIRKSKGYRQRDIAEYLGITESAYGYYEKGRNEPSIKNLQKLGELYNLTVSEIIGEEKTNIDFTEILNEKNVLNWEGTQLDEEDIQKTKDILSYILHEKRHKKESRSI